MNKGRPNDSGGSDGAALGTVGNAIVALSRALRERGVQCSVDSELVLARSLAEIDLGNRSQVYWAARSALVRCRDDGAAFDLIFDRFWEGLDLIPLGGRVAEHGESDPRMSGPQHGGDSMPQFRLEGHSGSLLDGDTNKGTRDIPTGGSEDTGGREQRRGVLAAYSPNDADSEPEALDYARDELDAVRRLGEELRRAHPERLSRRMRPSSRRGRLDMRGTVRESLRTEGEAFRPAWTARSKRPRRVLMICDVSGSMERYSRYLLASLRAAVGAGIKAEAFVFATRLTRLTTTLRERDPARAMDRARADVVDWSGGTRIGEALAEFNRTYARLGIARGAIVIIASDGWDRGDPGLLRRETRRLQMQSRRLIWINPRPVDFQSQPLAIGMQAALPYIDELVQGHDARAALVMASLLQGLDPGRPARRQVAVH